MTEKIPTGKRLNQKEAQALTAKLAAGYEAGATLRDLAEETGRSYGSVHRMLSLAGVVFRPRGGKGKRKPEGAGR